MSKHQNYDETKLKGKVTDVRYNFEIGDQLWDCRQIRDVLCTLDVIANSLSDLFDDVAYLSTHFKPDIQ